MKKLIALLLGALLLVSAAACVQKQDEQPEEEGKPQAGESQQNEPLSGGWQLTENCEMTDELRAIFEKALDGLTGVNYVPIACLGTQVVAGTNYCFLTQGTVVYPGAAPTYKLVYVYEDLSGNAEILNIADMPVVAGDDGTLYVPETETLAGGWFYPESYEITDEMKASLENAFTGLPYLSCDPIANVGEQVVAGMNRCLLCRATPISGNPVPRYALVYVYFDLAGGATAQFAVDFDIGGYCTYGA